MLFHTFCLKPPSEVKSSVLTPSKRVQALNTLYLRCVLALVSSSQHQSALVPINHTMYTIHPCYLWRAVAVGVGSLGRWAAARCHSVKGRGAKAGTSRHLGRALVRPASQQYSTVQYSTVHLGRALVRPASLPHTGYTVCSIHQSFKRRFTKITRSFTITEKTRECLYLCRTRRRPPVVAFSVIMNVRVDLRLKLYLTHCLHCLHYLQYLSTHQRH